MRTYRNPILPGFHPDPAVERVGGDYYLVTSSFQWFPGIPIYTSRDLVHWQPVGYALTRDSQLDLRGIGDSLGVWAPDIRFIDGVFYIAYTDMRRYNKNNRRDRLIENKLVRATDPAGPWSDPVVINGSGIDPSIFRDDDGRIYWVNQVYGPDTFSRGIECCEIDLVKMRLTGEARILWPGTAAGYTEGPHLYRRGEWYYLLTAEGGTFHNHQCSIARSRDLWGPYETIPGNPLLTMRDTWRKAGISRSGHGDFIETGGDLRHIAFLAARPYGPRDCANLGRETFMLPVEWTPDGWPAVNGGRGVSWECPFPDLPEQDQYPTPSTDDFDSPALAHHWNTCRNPDPARMSLAERPGYLRVRACQWPLSDIRHVNLVARRQETIDFTAETTLAFDPPDSRAEAGIVCYYDTRNHLTLSVTREGDNRIARLAVHRTDPGPEGSETVTDSAAGTCPLPRSGPVTLRVDARGQDYRFFAGPENGPVATVGTLEGSILSDEHAMTFGWGFTGAFVGMYAVDAAGRETPGDFRRFGM